MDINKQQLFSNEKENTSVDEKIKKARRNHSRLIQIDKLDKEIVSLKKKLAMKEEKRAEFAKEL